MHEKMLIFIFIFVIHCLFGISELTVSTDTTNTQKTEKMWECNAKRHIGNTFCMQAASVLS